MYETNSKYHYVERFSFLKKEVALMDDTTKQKISLGFGIVPLLLSIFGLFLVC